jgi:hypothetical protein
MKGRQQIALFAAVYFVPEGQHDSNQARSAWSHEENIPVPAGRLNGSRLRLDANIPSKGIPGVSKGHEHSTRCRLLLPGLDFEDKYSLGLARIGAGCL